MRLRPSIAAGLVPIAALALTVGSFAQSRSLRGTENGEWRYWGGDSGSNKYSALSQIDRTNFSRLMPAWQWASVDATLSLTLPNGAEWTASADDVFAELNRQNPKRWRAGRAPFYSNLKATPLMIGGVLYIQTPLGQAAALDAETGRTLWIYNPRSYEEGSNAMQNTWNERGLAYWSDGKEARVFFGTGAGYLYALDAKTGKPILDFGSGGRVDLLPELPRAERAARNYLGAMEYSVQSPPIVVRDTVIAPASIDDRRIKKEAIPGNIMGWDARTGRMKWIFHVIPRPGEPGIETWKNDSWKYTGNGNVWSTISGDEELGYVYLPTTSPTNDFYGGHRLGDNLYADSIVCLDATTGKRVWHFQTIHHDLWDYDNPTAPNLIDITVDGRPIKALAQVTKQAFTYVLDRVTGKPVWPIEERPVPPATIPGDEASPTQPFPTKPPPFDYQGVAIDDLADFTPEIRQMAIEVVKRFKIGPLYTPHSLPDPAAGTQGTLMRPSQGGGANWPGAASDPETGILYVPSANSFETNMFYTPDPATGGTLRYTHGFPGEPYNQNENDAAAARDRRPAMPDGLPLFKPPYSRITAIDLNKGDHKWMVPNGNGDNVRNHPRLKSLNLPPVGGDGRGGPLLTKTLFISPQSRGGVANKNGPRLVARDKDTGAEVGAVDLPGNALGNPMTYLWKGKQYIAVTVVGDPPQLVAFVLPEAATTPR
jgi:quinoprotein glucose dehydrogenase